MTDPVNPYDRSEFDSSTVTADVAFGSRPRRPGGLTAVCVLAIVLGVMGLCNAMMKAGALSMGSHLQNLMPASADNPADDLQREMYDQVQQRVGRRYFVANVAFTALHAIVAAGLLVGGIMTLGFRPQGRSLLLITSLLAIFYELGRSALDILQQLATLGVMQPYLDKIRQAPAPGMPRGAMETLAWLPRITILLTIVMVMVFLVAKLTYYVIAVVYLRRAEIQELFPSDALLTESGRGAAG